MKCGAGLLHSLLCAFVAVNSTSVELDVTEENERYDHVWEEPDLRGTGLVAIDGDIVAPFEDTTARKGIDFESWFEGILKWTDGVVYYWFDEDLTSRHRGFIRDAMKHWEESTCLKFEPAHPHQKLFYINFRRDNRGCYSQLGRMLFGQDINLGDDCVKQRTAIHEIGHAIGLYHEQSRSDRDKFIKIHWGNVAETRVQQFRLVDDNPKGAPYDYTSVMQYSESAFRSDVDKNTIATLDPFLQLSLGGPKLSFRDRKTANAMYECDGKCFNRRTLKCENGGFMFQRHNQSGNCSCVCPPNTSGNRCEILLKRSYYDYPKCGGNVTSEGTIRTLNAPNTTYEDGACIFWIRAPEGKYPRVEFSFFKFEDRRKARRLPLSEPKCRGERVEIRISDLYQGRMYCSRDLEGKNITSTTKNIIIIATPKYSGLPGGFEGFVRFIDAPRQARDIRTHLPG